MTEHVWGAHALPEKTDSFRAPSISHVPSRSPDGASALGARHRSGDDEAPLFGGLGGLGGAASHGGATSPGHAAGDVRAPSDAQPADETSDEPSGDGGEHGLTGAPPKKRRRGTRGGRRRRGRGAVGSTPGDGHEPAVGGTTDGSAQDDAEVPAGSPEVADRIAGSGTETPGEPGSLDSFEPAPGGEHPKKRSRRGRRRGRRGAPSGSETVDAGPVEPPLLDPDEEFAPPTRPASSTARPGSRPQSAPHRAPRPPRGAPRTTQGTTSGITAGQGGQTRRPMVPREIDAELDLDLPPDGATTEPFTPFTSGTPAGSAGPGGSGFDAGHKKRRRRGSRGGRRRKLGREGAPGIAAGPSPRALAPRHAPLELESIPGEDDDFPELPELPAETELVEPGFKAAPPAPLEEGGRKRRSKRGDRRGEKREVPERLPEEDDEPAAIPEAQRTALILVNATDPEEQRVAVVEGDRIMDFQMTVKDQDSLVNDIYRGRVVNLEPAIGAAFVDFGQGRNGFLHTSDVLSVYGEKDWSLDKLLSTKIDPDEWDSESSQPSVSAEVDEDEEGSEPAAQPKGGRRRQRPVPDRKRRFRARPRLPITDLLKKGEMVVVQVTKDAIGDKGPTLTTYISIPGRYLVLMPSMARTGVSRKIEDEKERRRLKRILQSLEVPPGMGVIVRTAGIGHSKAEIKRDLDYLKSAWEAFGKRLDQGHGPAPLYRESDVAIRTMRDMFTPLTKAVVVDDPEVHRHICEFTEKLMPENVDRVKLHQGSRPLFQSYGIEPEFEKIFSRRIELPSGGSIVFDQAEALVAIDVNSGRTRSDGFDFEEIALKTNLEAVPEIARQIRLRDLGGIIVCDFIDMMKLANIRTVERRFQAELDTDRARSKVGRISQFGLLELTRQRLGPGMSKKVFHTCPRCRGTGRIRTVNSRAAAILRRLASAMTLKGFTTVEVKAHPEVIGYLKSDCSEYIRALEYRFQREVKLFDSPEQLEDSVLRYLRADGREVRPGGRRKR